MKQIIKRLALNIRIQLLSSNSAFLRRFYEKSWKPKSNSIDELIDQFSRENRSNQTISFIQVGSNDGFQNDPICKFIKRDNWQGILIEPQTSVLPTLSRIYKHNKVSIINKAIAANASSKKFYKLAISDARWATGLSSFVKEHIQNQIDSGYIERKAKKDGLNITLPKDQWIEEIEVPCATFNSIMSEPYFKNHLSILVVDTEGFDFEILKLFPFDKIKPKLLIYEVANLNENDLKASEELLINYGYELRKFPPDNVAVLKPQSNK